MSTTLTPEQVNQILQSMQALTAHLTSGGGGVTANQLKDLTEAINANTSSTLTTELLPASAATFAVTSGQHNVEHIINYGTKGDKSLYDSATKELPTKFSMKSQGTVTFVDELYAHSKETGWFVGSKNITKFIIPNPTGVGDLDINLLTQYEQIDPKTLQTKCESFIKGVDKETKAAQNNEMM